MIIRRITTAVLLLVMAIPLTAQPAWALSLDTYVVQPGDYLSAIAQRHGTTVEALVAANSIMDPNLIHVGQRLTIPAGASNVSVARPAAPASPARPSAGPNSILANSRIVTYYGNPYSAQMGILGELDPSTLVARLKRAAQYYEAADGRPAIPAIHFIATVAQAGPGSDGMYRARMPMAEIEKYSRLAADNGLLFIIDIQVGRSTVEEELAPYVALLQQPHVHLALDPEFDMWGSDLPGIQLGHMTAAEVNYAVTLLAGIQARVGGPNKILIVYQFTASMLPDKQAISTNPRVDLAIVMDGFGGREIKLRHYGFYVKDEPVQFGGIKMFFRQDTNLLLPADIVQLDPRADVVVYQ